MDDAPASRVLAILVANDGRTWLDEALDGLMAQSHGNLEIRAVDNGSRDGSRDLLLDRLGPERVLVAERDLGFGAAVQMALDAVPARPGDLLLLLHDDAAPEPHAAALLAEHLRRFPSVAIAGAKKVDWDDPGRLQSIGWSVDITGRVDTGLEPDERDQGQRDHVHRALAVSTAGMMVRREVFEELGGFDRRYHLFRDDLDLCWRAWIAGHEVETVPAARIRHAASAANLERLGQTVFLGPRYFAERNTLATLCKNYGGTRLLVVLPLFMLMGLLRLVGFVATRRLGDAWQTVRAWAWNLLHVRDTWRWRRRVQTRRRRSDAELRPLFARILPRAQAYAEVVVDWVTGGEAGVEEIATVYDEEREPETVTERLARGVRRHPVGTAAGVLAVLAVAASLPVLDGGPLRGGDFAPWPETARAFLADYGSVWHDAGGIGSAAAPSPAQALLGMLDLLAVGNAWLAPRLLLLGALPAAWVLTLRATRIVSTRRLPRLAAATAYALSPPAIAALLGGHIGGLVVLVCLPALAMAFHAAVRPGAGPATAWRGVAAAAIIGAVAVSFEPVAAVGLAAWLVLTLAAVPGLATDDATRRGILARLLAIAVGLAALLLPWGVDLLAGDGPLFGGTAEAVGAAAAPFWRIVLLSPDVAGFPGVLAGGGILAAGILGIALAFRRRPLEVASLWTVALGGIFAAWGLARAGETAWSWIGIPLIVSAGALAALLALAFASAGAALEIHDFGWRQMASAITSLAVAVGLVASGVAVLADGWESFSTEPAPLPAFIATETEEVGPFRVLMLFERGGAVEWEVVGGIGPTMASHGVTAPSEFVTEVDRSVRAVMGGSDPGAASRLGLLNIRYAVVPPGGESEELLGALAGQLELEPQPVEEGAVFRIRDWVPEAAWMSPTAARAVEGRGELPPSAEIVPLEVEEGPVYHGEVPGRGSVVLPQLVGEWRARSGVSPLPADRLAGLVRFSIQDGPDGEGSDPVTAAPAGQGRRTAVVIAELAVLLLAFSLLLRPPGFARRADRQRETTGSARASGRREGSETPVGAVP